MSNRSKNSDLILIGTDDFLESGLTLPEMRQKALQRCMLEGKSIAVCKIIAIASASRKAHFLDIDEVDLKNLPVI